MRRILSFLIVVLATLMVGCYNDATTDNVNVGESVTTLTLTTPATRTVLGEKQGDSYPLYWSEGDCIVVNGQKSNTAEIDVQNKSLARFVFDSAITYPFNITYPYTTTTTAQSPKVVFPAEQNYAEGTFAEGCAPMCGYVAKSSDAISLKHLAGVLRFAVKSNDEGVILDRIVVTSQSAELAGEFVVNCQSGVLTSGEDTQNSVTYTLPENFALSTSQESLFHIALPAGNQGRCSVEFVEESGDRMTAVWDSQSSLTAGVVREFKPITYKRGYVGTSLESLDVEYDILYTPYTVQGYVRDSSGKPVANVAVSDGFTVVTTDANGYYYMKASTDCWYIYITLPAEYEVPTDATYGLPCFYQKFEKTKFHYNFTLTPLSGGKESKFALFALGDPQASNKTKVKRFKNEAVPGIKKYSDELEAQGIPCYGITLGDIISNSSRTGDSAANDEYIRGDMRDGFNISLIGMPVFHTMGNHDCTYYDSASPVFVDERNSSWQLMAQRNFEDMFGPVNYSFDRGDAHIIAMRNILYDSADDSTDYHKGFSDAQYNWLLQDLALVPKDKVIFFCVHIPFVNKLSGSYDHFKDVMQLLNSYKEVHILSGHTHYIQNYDYKQRGTAYTNIYEHNVGAVCGAWWICNLCGDGTPNGYQVFITNGTTVTDWYNMGFHEGMNTRNHQMRLYRGNAITGGAKPEDDADNTNGTKGYYAFNLAENVVIANVYNADDTWVIKVYEDDEYSGDMTKFTGSHPNYRWLIGNYTLENPRRFDTDEVEPVHDMYVAGLMLGVLGNSASDSGCWTVCNHLYKYELKNKDAKIKVVATDRFGNEYVETKITEGTDYSLVKP